MKSGFIAILGRPNVGKSSIMNYLVGEKVAIVSPKAQTTRAKALGVLTRGDVQMVFVDTPGIHRPRTKLGEFMMKSVKDARDGVDCIMVVLDGTFIGKGDLEVMQSVKNEPCPKFLVINKTDIAKPEELMPRLSQLDVSGFDEVVSVSARKGTNMDKLYELLENTLPEGPAYFPADMMTDQPERVMIAEIIREKALNSLRDEIPHGVGVEMLSIQKLSDRLTEIHANVYCERAAHKSIIIGKHGEMLGRIGSEARMDIEKLLDTKVMLRLWVKVREDWRNRAEDLKNLGYVDEK
ncbi:MAG: GTPase Era [Clostridia bacterium]|nr:GTPase Era [Clostridia bacterium]